MTIKMILNKVINTQIFVSSLLIQILLMYQTIKTVYPHPVDAHQIVELIHHYPNLLF